MNDSWCIVLGIDTIKYRINKMIKNAGVEDKNGLLALIRSYDIKFE